MVVKLKFGEKEHVLFPDCSEHNFLCSFVPAVRADNGVFCSVETPKNYLEFWTTKSEKYLITLAGEIR